MRHFSPVRFGRIFSAMRLFICLDFDGTLAPFRRVPASVKLSREKKFLLGSLARCPGCVVAVISGRSLKDIEGRVGDPMVMYGADHGFFIRCGANVFRPSVSPAVVRTMGRFFGAAGRALKGIPGVLQENKGVTLTVHYRRAAKSAIPTVKERIHALAASPAFSDELEVREGKMCLEIRPRVPWDKGSCIAWLLLKLMKEERAPFLPVYIGDDETDEDAFRAIRSFGLTVRVGKKSGSAAEYYLKDTREVSRALRMVLKMKQGGCR